MNRRLEGRELDDCIVRVRDALIVAFRPHRIILFGSFARGDQNRTSDLDLVVIADTPLPFMERIGTALQVASHACTKLPIEPLVYTSAEWESMTRSGSSFVSLVSEEGRVLYEQGSEPDRGRAVARPGAPRP